MDFLFFSFCFVLFNTGRQKSPHMTEIVDWDVKHQHKQTAFTMGEIRNKAYQIISLSYITSLILIPDFYSLSEDKCNLDWTYTRICLC